MAKLLDSPFWELLAKRQQTALTKQLILSLSSQLEPYGYQIVPLHESTQENSAASSTTSQSKKRGRRGKPVEYNGQRYESLAQACAKLGVSYSTAAVRRKKGQATDKILDELLAKKKPHSNSIEADTQPKVMRRPAGSEGAARYPMAAKLQAVRQIRGS